MATFSYEPSQRARPNWPLSLKWLSAYVVACAALCLYSVSGIRLVQWKLGIGEIWEPATGTDAYDRWLIEVPLYGIAMLTLLWSAIGFYWLFTRRWRSALALWVTVLPIFVFVEMFMIFVIWEPASP